MKLYLKVQKWQLVNNVTKPSEKFWSPECEEDPKP